MEARKVRRAGRALRPAMRSPSRPRSGAVSIGSGSGKGSPAGCRASMPVWRLVCRLRLVRVGSARMAGWPHFLSSLFRGAICPLLSEKRSLFSTPVTVECVRSPGSWADHRRRSQRELRRNLRQAPLP